MGSRGLISLTSCSNLHNTPNRILGLTFGDCKRLPPPNPKDPGDPVRQSPGSSSSCDSDHAKEAPLALSLRNIPASTDASTLPSFIPKAGLLPAPQREYLGDLRSLGEGSAEGGTPRDLVVILHRPPHPPPAAGNGGAGPG